MADGTRMRPCAGQLGTRDPDHWQATDRNARVATTRGNRPQRRREGADERTARAAPEASGDGARGFWRFASWRLASGRLAVGRRFFRIDAHGTWRARAARGSGELLDCEEHSFRPLGLKGTASGRSSALLARRHEPAARRTNPAQRAVTTRSATTRSGRRDRVPSSHPRRAWRAPAGELREERAEPYGRRPGEDKRVATPSNNSWRTSLPACADEASRRSLEPAAARVESAAPSTPTAGPTAHPRSTDGSFH